MIKELREKFNKNFTEEKYNNYVGELNSILKFPVDFRLSETPLFLTDRFTNELSKACDEILLHITSTDFTKHNLNSVPEGLSVHGEDSHPTFLQIDFAIAVNKQNELIPQLIELQGFPSLYAFQVFQNRLIKKHFDIPLHLTPYFNGLNEESYIKFFRETLLENSATENVILMEIEPEKQKTRIDFAATEYLTGIKTVCLTKISRKQNKLYYNDNGKEILIERIYNRVIFDELQRKQIKLNFNLFDEVDVKWVSHPNWFFRISKHSLPFLKGEYIPKCYFLDDMREYPSDLNQFVLKPLYSFAGLGVDIHPTIEKLKSIKNKSHYLLQEKVKYAPVVETPDGFSKCEIRMMFIWKDKPVLVNNLVRMSKGEMMGVDFNKNKTWIGSSLALHPENF